MLPNRIGEVRNDTPRSPLDPSIVLHGGVIICNEKQAIHPSAAADTRTPCKGAFTRSMFEKPDPRLLPLPNHQKSRG